MTPPPLALSELGDGSPRIGGGAGGAAADSNASANGVAQQEQNLDSSFEARAASFAATLEANAERVSQQRRRRRQGKGNGGGNGGGGQSASELEAMRGEVAALRAVLAQKEMAETVAAAAAASEARERARARKVAADAKAVEATRKARAVAREEAVTAAAAAAATAAATAAAPLSPSQPPAVMPATGSLERDIGPAEPRVQDGAPQHNAGSLEALAAGSLSEPQPPPAALALPPQQLTREQLWVRAQVESQLRDLATRGGEDDKLAMSALRDFLHQQQSAEPVSPAAAGATSPSPGLLAATLWEWAPDLRELPAASRARVVATELRYFCARRDPSMVERVMRVVARCCAHGGCGGAEGGSPLPTVPRPPLTRSAFIAPEARAGCAAAAQSPPTARLLCALARATRAARAAHSLREAAAAEAAAAPIDEAALVHFYASHNVALAGGEGGAVAAAAAGDTGAGATEERRQLARRLSARFAGRHRALTRRLLRRYGAAPSFARPSPRRVDASRAPAGGAAAGDGHGGDHGGGSEKGFFDTLRFSSPPQKYRSLHSKLVRPGAAETAAPTPMLGKQRVDAPVAGMWSLGDATAREEESSGGTFEEGAFVLCFLLCLLAPHVCCLAWLRARSKSPAAD
jgi:hypothetical protein